MMISTEVVMQISWNKRGAIHVVHSTRLTTTPVDLGLGLWRHCPTQKCLQSYSEQHFSAAGF